MSSVSLKKINSPTLCFFIGLVVWQFGQMLNLSSFDSIYAVTGIIEKVLEIFGLTLIVFSQFMVGKLCFFKNKVIVTFIILFYFIFNNGLLAKDMTIVTICLILFCTNGIDLDKVISNYFWIRIIYFSFIIFLSLVNVLPNVVTYRAEGSPRYNLGFFWTSFSAYSFFFCILYLIWTNKKISNFYLIIITFINQLFFELTNTK
ncbi:hypothetical protein, partial [Liquorilactobacillus uvarum]|uniref:hypothetical protein n=1 Tax=Liquorilactobacillus uvarum TaxID=303240 RepID=UPI002889FDC1